MKCVVSVRGECRSASGREVIHLFSEDGDAIFFLAHFLGMEFDFLKAKFCFQEVFFRGNNSKASLEAIQLCGEEDHYRLTAANSDGPCSSFVLR